VAQNEQAKKRLSSEERLEAIYAEIREKICLLEYPPGMALREETLAEEYGVSRTPIRTVLKRLESEELVTHTPGAGVIVTIIDLKLLRDVYKLRLKIAEFVGEMMTTRIDDSVVPQLEQILAECQNCRHEFNPTQVGRLYHDFDEIMRGLIANQPLRRIQDRLFHQTARVWLDILPELDWEDEIDIMREEIADVIDALRESDMQRVATIRRDHLLRLLQRISNYLGSADIS
jgi:DNA-binding GntR family transcriptional regulator